MTNFQLEEFANRGSKLLKATQKIFDEYKDLGLREVSLPETMKPSDGAVKLVFVGQYSSGKSSIIKMLSGIDTKIGAGIETQEAATYKWGDLEIIDTPGIHTELRPDHDEKTYYEIDHAALLIFVVTNEGFDDRMGNHFRKLAIEQNRGKNMVLVVNKMDRTALGNVPEQQEIIAKDMEKVIAPFTGKQLYLSFLNTNYYFEQLEESDPEMKEILFEQSGYEDFVKNLNAFVASRGVLSKIQAPLETLKSAIISVIGESENRSVDKDIEAVEELLKRRQKALLDGKRRIKTEITEIAETLCSRIKAEGSIAASSIARGITEDEAKRNIEKAQLQAETYVNSYENQIIDKISEICEDVNKEISLIDNSNFAININLNLSNKLPVKVSEKEDITITSAKNAYGINSALVKINTTSKAASSMSVSLPVLGDLKATGVIKDIGHFFGFKFQPWGAANLLKGATKFLGYVGLAITAYQIFSKIFGEDEQKKMEDNLRNARAEIQKEFDRGAEDIRNEIINSSVKKMDELTAPVFQDAENKLNEFKNKKERLKSMGHSLQDILVEIGTLMNEVQQTAKI